MLDLLETIGPRPEIRTFLKLAGEIAAAVAQLHQSNVVHQNLRPKTIQIDQSTLAVELVGRALYSPESAPPGQSIPEAALPYMAPEQTGRVNRRVDPRADLYSLGVTFYEVLAGAAPFHADDLLGWVHCHIARTARPLAQANPSVPEPLSDIVMKLLAKLPEDRYQSARGLEVDLRRCLVELEEHGRIASFSLGERDVWGTLRIPVKLYGRDSERERLYAAFERIVSEGGPELLLVSGYSGIGKSVLVQELQKPVVHEKGFFLSGKFEQYKRDIPYFTFGQAFQGLVRQILAESEVRLEAIRRRLLDALGPNGQLIVEMVPQVELVIGKQPAVSPLAPGDAQTRFNTTFSQFVTVLASKEHPLVLFLDDLQWADFGSLDLLRFLVAQKETRNLLVVGAYRDNEVDASHPLMATLEGIRRDGGRVSALALGPLAEGHLTQLVADTFHCSAGVAEPLAGLLNRKTSGNPFFAIQLLSALCQDGLIHFDAAASAWRWSVPEIDRRDITDDIVELMIGKIGKLLPATQEAVKRAACLGAEFSASIMALVGGETPIAIQEKLQPAVQEGLLVRRGDTYTFAHDRVQQTAYSLLPAQERDEIHLHVGRKLLEHTPEHETDDRLHEIVHQLNQASALIHDAREARLLIDLNLRAGRRAQAAAAHKSAAAYFAAARSRLTEASWAEDYDVARAVHIGLAECEYLDGRFDEAERLCDLVSDHVRASVDAAPAYHLKIRLANVRVDNVRSLAIGFEYLRRLGLDLPSAVTAEEALAAIRAVREQLDERSIEGLLDLPMMTDPEMVAAVITLEAMIVPAMYVDQNINYSLLCRMLSLSMQHGNTAASTYGYAMFAMSVLCQKCEDYAEGYRLGKVAYTLSERPEFFAFAAPIAYTFGGLTAIWRTRLRESLPYIQRGIRVCNELGSPLHGCIARLQFLACSVASGAPLDEMSKRCDETVAFARKAEMSFLVECAIGVQRLIHAMDGRAAQPSTSGANAFVEAEFEERLRNNVPIVVFWYYVYKLQSRFILGDHAAALHASVEAGRMMAITFLVIQFAVYHYYTALALTATFEESSEEERAARRGALAVHLEKLRIWADNCPDNYLGHYTLVRAEIARVEGRTGEAADLYNEAVQAFRGSEFVQDEAVCSELAARFYAGRGFTTIPAAYMKEASACYARWGATEKVRQLDGLYPHLLGKSSSKPPRTSSADLGQLEVMTALKASQALSSELGPNQLLNVMIRILVEHSGAQRCCLLMMRGEELAVSVDARVGDHQLEVRICDPAVAPSATMLPVSLVQFVKRARESIVLEDATEQGSFASDEYIARERTRSVLCLPVMRQARLAGLVYLENNLVSGAFSSRQIAILQFLAGISLENTSLYAELAERREVETALRDALDRERLDLIERQHDEIRKLSSPIIEVWEGVLTMPIFGEVSDARAQRMTEALLDAVARTRSRHAILDLTGAEGLTTQTADHIIKMVRALQLLGARGIVVGIRPEVAQTMVAIGVDLSGIITLSNLREALLFCMKVQAASARRR